jgi:acyl-CoA synthetase (NDP forming)
MAEAALKVDVQNDKASARQAVVRSVLGRVKSDGRNALTAPEGKIVCDAYGIPVPQEGVAASAQEAKGLAERMGFPVVMKIVSPDILHKTEAGGVLVGLKSADEVAQGYETILKNAKAYKASAGCWWRSSRTSPSAWRPRPARTRSRCSTASRRPRCCMGCAAAIPSTGRPSRT